MSPSNDRSDAPGAARVLFSSSYGGFPRFFWYAVIPLLVLSSAVLFVRALWYDEGVVLASLRVPPRAVALVICPVIWLLCGLLVGLEAYRRRNPQFIRISTWGVCLPKSRFTSEVVEIAWNNLQATLTASNLVGWHVYEITCTDLRSHESARVSSALFPTFKDFSAFARFMSEHMGQDWPINGDRPGASRGQKAGPG